MVLTQIEEHIKYYGGYNWRSLKDFIRDMSILWSNYKKGLIGGGTPGPPGPQGPPGTGTTIHSELSNLGYNYSGHTGFSPEEHTHTGYEQTSNKGDPNGYAGLDSDSKVPTVNLGGAGADNTKYLRGDQTWQTVSGGSGLTHPQVLTRCLGC